jgi:6-methylsalicylate decarboxylase
MPVNRWIDVHAHFSLPLPVDVHDAVVETMRAACWRIDEAPSWDAASTLSYMDRAGIQMQMLSNIPKWLEGLRTSNDFGADLVRRYPDRFGLLAALPTDDPDAALIEIARADDELGADGYAVTCNYKGVLLGDRTLDPVWTELNRRRAVVFAHPDAYTPGAQGRPSSLIEVAFETTRTFTDMLYARVFARFPDITFVVAHCGGALPALSSRLALLGTESWVPNPNGLTAAELTTALSRLYLDTAATCPSALAAALAMTAPTQLLYGSERNREALLNFQDLTDRQKTAIGTQALQLFPSAAERLATSTHGHDAATS